MHPQDVTPYLTRAPQFDAPAPGFSARWLSDRALFFLFAATLFFNLALGVYLLARFESLPDVVPFHFDASGLPDRIEPKQPEFQIRSDEDGGGEIRLGIFGLPVIGFLVLLLNAFLAILAHGAERAASILLAAGALLVQLLMWLGAVNIAGGFL